MSEAAMEGKKSNPNGATTHTFKVEPTPKTKKYIG